MESLTAALQLILLQIIFAAWGNSQVCQLTQSDHLGPYHLHNAPFKNTVCKQTEGSTPLEVTGYIIGNNCQGIRNAVLEIWQADQQGNYDPAESWRYGDLQYDYTHANANGYQFDCRARVRSDQNGRFSFNTIVPAHYGSGWGRRPQHLHYRVSTPDGRSVDVSQMYFDFDPVTSKIESLTVKTENSANGVGKRAVFNFTMNAAGDVSMGNNMQEPGEEISMCYSCNPCPDYYNNIDVKQVQCPPNGCKMWWSWDLWSWSRGCKESRSCSINGEPSWCCEGDYCNRFWSAP